MNMSASGIRAGAAYVELLLEKNAFIRGLQTAQRRLKAFGTGISMLGRNMMAMGGMIAAPLMLATKMFMSTGDAVDKMNKRTGLSTQFLSEMAFAAEQSGASLEQFDKAMAAMARFSLQGEQGS